MIVYVFAALFAAFLVASGVASCEHKTIVSLEAGIEANKLEAKRILESETARVAAKEAADKRFSITLQGDYDAKLKTLSADYKRDLARLRDPGRDRGACPTSGAGSGAIAPASAADAGLLSAEATAFLYSEARRADEMRLWAQSCYDFVNKK